MIINIGIIGLGTVGSGVIETIEKNQLFFCKKYKIKLKIAVITAKNKNKKRSFDIKKYKWFKSPIDLAKSSEIDIVIELIGGASGLAFDIAKTALTNKKNLVTANKAMIAIHGYQLKRLANKYSVNLNFEASVAGGIPIIRTLENSLLSDKITKVYGILNGTCNYILTQMNEKNLSFDLALTSAQKLGYAEANPFDDVSGTDISNQEQPFNILIRESDEPGYVHANTLETRLHLIPPPINHKNRTLYTIANGNVMVVPAVSAAP